MAMRVPARDRSRARACGWLCAGLYGSRLGLRSLDRLGLMSAFGHEPLLTAARVRSFRRPGLAQHGSTPL
jgi:hypothetical protein